jgi:hypothetical protein
MFRRDAERDQRVALRLHERDRAADVVVGIRHQRILLHALRRQAPFEVVIDARAVVRADQLVQHRALEIRVFAHRIVQPVAERVHRARAAGVDEPHVALAAFGHQRRRHRHHRRPAHTAGDQHDRRIDAALQREFAHRRGHLDDRALLHAVVHQRGNLAGRNRFGLADSRFTEMRSHLPCGASDRLYWRGWSTPRSPTKRFTVTYWPGSKVGAAPPSAGVR